jgi:hypothetical protein
MATLSADQIAFLESQDIDLNDVFDASGMRRKDWRAKAKLVGKRYAFGVSACSRGHTLRTRSGHCIQCDTSKVAFGSRYSSQASIYIAGSRSGRCLKIGLSADDLDNRIACLRSQSYGGFGDWKVLAVSEPAQGAGKIEHAAQASLYARRVSGGYSNRAGVAQASQEVFSCGFRLASKALTEALPVGQRLNLHVEPHELEKYEWE